MMKCHSNLIQANQCHSKFDTKQLNAIPVMSVVERLGGKIKRQGNTYRTLCPWHNDTNPSLVLYQGRGNRCKCFACGKNGSVIDYVMQVRNLDFIGACEWLSEEFGIPGESSFSGESGISGNHSARKMHTIMDVLKRVDFNLKTRDALHKPKDFCYIKMSYLDQFVSTDNSFCKCLLHYFPEELVCGVTELYKLGCYNGLGNEDDVMFPSIDTKLRVHDIKIQHYDTDPDSTTFFHCDKRHIFWLSSLLKKDLNTNAFELPDSPEASSPLGGTGGGACLFGAHLLPDNPDMPVVLVESPKNAVVGTCAFEDYVWVAAGNKNGLSRDSLECLRGRKVYVIPDRDAIDDWKRELSKYEDITPFNFTSFCDNELLQLGEKGDIADYIIDLNVIHLS